MSDFSQETATPSSPAQPTPPQASQTPLPTKNASWGRTYSPSAPELDSQTAPQNTSENSVDNGQDQDETASYADIGPQPEKVVLEWQAANRPFKKRNRQYYTTIAIIVFLISLILFFAGQFLPIAVVIAAGFLAYVLSAVPPETITNQITTYGIRNDAHLYYWEELGRFWYTEKHKQRLLHIEVARFPHQLTLLLGDRDEEEVTVVLGTVLLQEKPLPTTFDKAAAWLQEKIPLDTDS
jgi:hypothetical protein